MELDTYIEHDSVLWTGVPDMNISIEDIIGQGELVMARFILRGTHKGNFLGIYATGKIIEMGGMLACCFVAGKIYRALDIYGPTWYDTTVRCYS